jgi:hypothetical protein
MPTRTLARVRQFFSALTKSQVVAFTIAVTGLVWAFFYPLGGGRFIAELSASPQPEVIIQQYSVRDCVAYVIAISTLRDEGVDRLDLTVQFPGVIADYASGASYLLDLNQNWRKGEAGFTLQEDPNGKCGIGPITSALPSPVFRVWKAGTGMVEVHGSKIPARMTFGAVFAMSQKTPSLSLITHGSYEYRRLGVGVSKPLVILDSGDITKIIPGGPWPLPPRAIPPTPPPERT